MFLILVFIFSGLAIVMLIVGKVIEEKRSQPLFLFDLISKGDRHVRELSHMTSEEYSEFKTRAEFFIKKQLQMQARSSYYRTQTLLREQSDRFLKYIRDSRLIKKSDGISEFFKSVSEVERGGGQIDGYSDAFQEDGSEVK